MPGDRGQIYSLPVAKEQRGAQFIVPLQKMRRISFCELKDK